MMAQPVISRTQRRVERKQLLLVVILILAVAGASFSLGVMFGKRSVAGPGGLDTPGSSLPQTVTRIEPPSKPSAAMPEEKPEPLTFYDNLPKGKQAPLGSGINLPPKQQVERPAAAAKAKAVPATPSPRPPKQLKANSPAVATDGFVVQVASFRTSQDAAKLAGRLQAYDLKVFIETADLGNKGIWYRVLSGPFGAREHADRTVEFLREKERLSAIVRQR